MYVTIGSDNVTGGFLATEHLINDGRKKIAFFWDVKLPEVASRFAGYRQALSAHQLPFDEQLVVPASFLENGGQIAMAELAARNVTYDGLFCCSDLLAMSAINILRDQNKQVPEDVAVVGYDDIELARYFHPPLTTIRQPIQTAGSALVDSLLHIIDQKTVTPQLLPTELIVRASSTTDQ